MTGFLRVMAFLAVAATVPARAAVAPPQDLQQQIEEMAKRCLKALASGDKDAFKELAAPGQVDPARVVFYFLRNDREALLGGTESPGALDAAAALARAAAPLRAGSGLEEMVQRRRKAEREVLERDRRLVRGAGRAEDVLAAGDPDSAARAYDSLAEDLRAASWSGVASIVTYDRAALLERMGRLAEAVEGFEDAIRRNREIGWVVALTDCRYRAAELRGRMGDLARARALWEEESEERTRAGDRAGCEMASLHLGLMALRSGEHGRSRELLTEVLAYARTNAPGSPLECSAALFLGLLEADCGNLVEARRNLEAGRRLARALGHTESVIASTINLLFMDSVEGDCAGALKGLERQVKECLARRQLGLAMTARYMLAQVQEQMGDVDSSERSFETALREAAALGDRSLAASIRAIRVRLAMDRGENERALEMLRESMEEDRKSGIRKRLASHLVMMAVLHKRVGKLPEALEAAERALAAATEASVSGDVIDARIVRAGLLRRLGRIEEAAAELDRTCSDADRTGSPKLQSESRASRARLRLERGDGAGSLADSRWALEGWLRLEGRLGEEGSQGFRATARVASDLGIRACAAGTNDGRDRLSAGLAPEAVFFAEGGRAMALAEALSNRQRMLAASVSAEAVEQEVIARRRLEAARAKLLVHGSAAVPDFLIVEGAKRALTEAEAELRAARARLQRESRRGASIAFPSPRPLAEIVAAVGPRAALVHYQADGEDGRLRALVVAEGGAWIRDLGPAAGILEGAEGWLRAASTDGGDEAGAARTLYDALLRPLEPLLAGKERLLLSPDGRLSFLPFEALLRAEGGKEERAIERWEIALVPSGSVLVELREDARGNPAGEGAVVLGDPVYASEAPAAARAPAPGTEQDPLRFGSLERLPGTGEEAKAVAARFPAERTTLLLRGDATRARLQEALAGAKGRLAAVHLACHGRIDPDHPALTGLALGAGEILDLHDFSSLRISADLVVLSACDTGRGRVAVGEGVMGFVRAVFFAGSPRVVVSNWKVPDEGTRILMDRFYEGLRVRGLPAGATLRDAKRAFLAERGPRSHPYHWAGFVLWGLPD